MFGDFEIINFLCDFYGFSWFFYYVTRLPKNETWILGPFCVTISQNQSYETHTYWLGQVGTILSTKNWDRSFYPFGLSKVYIVCVQSCSEIILQKFNLFFENIFLKIYIWVQILFSVSKPIYKVELGPQTMTHTLLGLHL